MIRFILPFVFVGIAIACFIIFISPFYQDIRALGVQTASYDEALSNSKALENERDKLTAKYNTINPEDLTKIQKLLPDNIDNIRLILEIEKIAAPYGMILKNVKYSGSETTNGTGTPGSVAPQGTVQNTGAVNSPNNYGILDLEFSTSGTYSNFINLTRSLENNLRIVDISSITFSSDNKSKNNQAGVYDYSFKIKTYWLKK